MSDPVLLVFATFPSRDLARTIGRMLVEERLVACVNLLPQVESIYRWQGAVETAEETLALYKTTETRYPAFQGRLKELHPYEVPEIVAVSIAHALPSYLKWVAESVER